MRSALNAVGKPEGVVHLEEWIAYAFERIFFILIARFREDKDFSCVQEYWLRERDKFVKSVSAGFIVVVSSKSFICCAKKNVYVTTSECSEEKPTGTWPRW